MASEKDVIGFPLPVMQQTKIHSASVQLVVSCKCGNPTPIMVHFIPGVPLTAFCPQCQVKFKLGRFLYDVEKGTDELHVGVVEMVPTIVQPGGFHG